MNITFLIGNGFDINCGMKCTYRNAYKGYINTQSNSSVTEQFKKRIGEDIDTWADFEVAMAADMVNYKNEGDFLVCLRDFKKYLNQYLCGEEKKIFNQLNYMQVMNAVQQEMRNSIVSFYDNVSHNLTAEIGGRIFKEGAHYEVISFNYTSVFDKIISSIMDVGNVIHIHGKLNDDPVLGMDNLKQLPEISYRISNKGKRAFIKSVFNREFDRARVKAAEDAIALSDIICVFGMSLGISDQTWKNLIIQWLCNTQNTHLFLYNYKCSCLNNLTADERLDYEEDTKRDILKAFELELSKIEYCESKIHIPCGKNIFNIENAISQGLNKVQKEQELLNELALSKSAQSVGSLG